MLRELAVGDRELGVDHAQQPPVALKQRDARDVHRALARKLERRREPRGVGGRVDHDRDLAELARAGRRLLAEQHRPQLAVAREIDRRLVVLAAGDLAAVEVEHVGAAATTIATQIKLDRMT